MNRWLLVPETFDPEKFKLRYGLTDQDFEYKTINGQTYVRLADGVVLPEGQPPIFEPLPTQIAEDYALTLATKILPDAPFEQRLDLARELERFKRLP